MEFLFLGLFVAAYLCIFEGHYWIFNLHYLLIYKLLLSFTQIEGKTEFTSNWKQVNYTLKNIWESLPAVYLPE